MYSSFTMFFKFCITGINKLATAVDATTFACLSNFN